MVRSFCEMVIQRKQAANISTYTLEPSRHFNFTCDDDDDDEEYSIPLKDMPQISSSIALVPVSSIMEPEDSLIMVNEELSTIPEKESDEFIKSNVENLIPILRESEDTSGSDSESILPSSNDFSIQMILPLVITDEYISSDVNPLFDGVLENIESKDSYVSSLDEPVLLVTHPSDFNEDKCFNPGGDVDEIEFLLHHDPSTPKISVASILEGFTDEPPLEENNDLFDLESKKNEWKKILYDAPINDLMTKGKIFDPGGDIDEIDAFLDIDISTDIEDGTRYCSNTRLLDRGFWKADVSSYDWWIQLLLAGVRGKGPNWLFDLDYLTDSMNYQHVTTENKANKTAGPKEANHSAGTEDNIDAGNSEMEAEPAQEYFTNEEPKDQEDQAFLEKLERLKRQEKEANDAAEAFRKEFAQCTEDLLLQAGAAKATSTNTVNTDIYNNPSDGIFSNASYDDEGAVVDFTNLETTVNVSPIPTPRIHSIHPTTQILGDPTSAVQIRSKIEPKKISQALEDESWVNAMQEELLQEEGINYDEVFALVARIEAIRIFLAFASYMGFIVYQMDVKSALLYGTIDEEVYVSQPSGFVDPKFPKKSGYIRGTINKNLFIKKDKNDIMLVQVYVDDIIFGFTKKSWCDDFEALMKSRFQMCSMGELTFFLRLQVKQKEDGIFISQDNTPIETHNPLTKDEEAADVDVHLYRSMIGSLMYLTTSRPDIMFAVCACSRFQCKKQTIVATSTTEAEYVAAANCCGQNPVFHSKTKHTKIRHHFIRDAYEKKLIQVRQDGDYRVVVQFVDEIVYSCIVCACSRFQVTPKTSHLHAMKRNFRYLKGKPKLGLWYPRVSSFDLEAYLDSDYAGANLDRKSTIGGCQFLGRRLISWQCKKQTIMATSTTEAECVVAANCLFHSKTKHIEIRHHFIRYAYEKKLIQVLKIHTDDNVADLLTKAFDVSRFNFLTVNIGMINLQL
ncbi:putative ribonuclease H-like domain-containing protein [Tanacetum coccineum]